MLLKKLWSISSAITHSIAVLPENKVLDFVSHPNQNKSKKNKKLVESIKIAYQILQGTTTFEDEQNKILKKPKGRHSAKSVDETPPTPILQSKTIKKTKAPEDLIEDFDEDYIPPEPKRVTRSKGRKSKKTLEAEESKELDESFNLSQTVRKSTRKRGKGQDKDLESTPMQIEDKKKDIPNFEKLLQTKMKQVQFNVPPPLQQPQPQPTPATKSAKAKEKKIENISYTKDYEMDTPLNVSKKYQTSRKPQFERLTGDRDLRNTSSEFIYKKPRISPNFQKKLSSIKPTILKDKLTNSLSNQKKYHEFQ